MLSYSREKKNPIAVEEIHLFFIFRLDCKLNKLD